MKGNRRGTDRPSVPEGKQQPKPGGRLSNEAVVKKNLDKIFPHTPTLAAVIFNIF